MENGFKIMGKNLSPERKKDFGEKHSEVVKKSELPFDNEIKKSEKANEVLGFINNCLNVEFEKMGLKYEDVPLEKIHIFSKEDFVKTFPDRKNDGGLHAALHGGIAIKAGENRANIFMTIVHEMIHAASYKVYYVDEKSDELDKIYRCGYENTQHQEKDAHKHFIGFNEGMIDFFVSEIAEKYKVEINKILEVTDNDWKDLSWYYDECELIDLIMEKIAEQKGEPWEEVYLRFKKGLFTGEMMHLRDVEKVFGDGSLRIFSYFQEGLKYKNEKEQEFQKKIYEFFQTKDENRREELRKEILG